MIRFPATLLIALAAFAACLARSAPAVAEDKLSVAYADGRQLENVTLKTTERQSDELYVSAYDLARIFKATKYWNPTSRKLVLRIGSHRYLFTIDARLVVVDDSPVLLHVPVRYDNGSVMIPLEFIPLVLVPNSREKIEFDETRLTLVMGSPRYNVTGVAIEDGPKGTRAIIALDEELLYHVDSETPGLLRLKIYGGRLNPARFDIPRGKGLMNRVRAEQGEHDAFLFFDVARDAARFRVELDGGWAGTGGRRLILFLEKGALPEIPEADFAGKKMTEILETGAGVRNAGDVRVVVIDPGHGGVENGRMSPSGLMEKYANLELARLLRDRLVEELGVAVVMTRGADETVPIESRIETANLARADLCISIHCNGWLDESAGGFETFFFAVPRGGADTAGAASAGTGASAAAVAAAAAASDLGFVAVDAAQRPHIERSSVLAEMIQRELGRVLEIRNRGVSQAGLALLGGLTMPAVLLEAAFLTNPEEEKLLSEPAFREKLIDGIIEGIRKFQDRYAAAPGGE